MIKQIRDDLEYMKEHPEYTKTILDFYGRSYAELVYWTVRGWAYIWIVSVILERMFLPCR